MKGNKSMNKLFYVGIAFALLAGCSSTPINDANAPSAGAGAGAANGELSLDKLRTDSLLTQRSIYFDFDKFEVKPEYLDVVKIFNVIFFLGIINTQIYLRISQKVY